MIDPTRSSRLHAIVNGHVQGVGFRFFVLEMAQELGITGWVRNTIRGQVEVVAEGSRVLLNKFLETLNQGPRSAEVSEVNVSWENPTGEFTSFNLRGTVF